MSLSSHEFVLIVYYGGEIVEGPNGVIFYGKKKAIDIKRGIKFKELKEKIQKKIGLKDNERISQLTFRFPESGGNYFANEVSDDGDVNCMFRAFVSQPPGARMEIYVEISHGELSSMPIDVATDLSWEDRNVSSSAPETILTQILHEEDDEEDHSWQIGSDDGEDHDEDYDHQEENEEELDITSVGHHHLQESLVTNG